MLARAAGRLKGLRLADAVLATVVVLVVGMMIVPLPTPLLDLLLATNIAIAVLVLLVALYVRDALAFASFPTLLLVTTLYRLALNVSSTRLILLQADAGDVIASFGNFVVRGNYVVGAVVFAILTLIQFLVIAKGAERVAEVGARFTLDAMPGKQMSIDAELRTGALTQDQARAKRRSLERESQFYGAMDGAMKFVKGDAIAGIVITIVNIVGGLAIGVGMRGLSAGESLETYGLLTIGDGLVSQIPALLVSTAAGLVVTRVASESEGASLGTEIASQVFGDPRALRAASVMLVVLAVVPGLPALPFAVLAVVFFAGARAIEQQRTRDVAAKTAGREKPQRARVPLVAPIAIEIGDALVARFVVDGEDKLLGAELPAMRDRIFAELGVIVPEARVVVGEGDRFTIALQEVPVASGAIPAGRCLARATVDELVGQGVAAEPAIDPETGAPAATIDERDRDRVPGVACLEPAAWVARTLESVVKRRAHELFGLDDAQMLLSELERVYPTAVRNVVPKPVSLPLFTDVLRRLLEEGVSVRPLREILETLSIHGPNERDALALTELVRAGLRRQISHRHARGAALSVHLLDPSIEDAVRDAIKRTASGSYLTLAPDLAREIVEAVRAQCGASFVLLTHADVRRFVRRLLETDLPGATVLSYGELAPEVVVQPLGRVAI